jgi:hypothetical protein
LFNINIRGKSKFNPDKVLFETKRNPNSANLTKDQLSSNSIKTALYSLAKEQNTPEIER